MTDNQAQNAVTRAARSRNGRILFAIVLVAGGAACLFATPQAALVSGHTAITAEAEAHVDEALAKNQQAFLVLSAIKAAIAVVEGSTVGMGFAIEVGDLIQPAYDYVNFFWQMFLVAFVVMGAYKVLLETGMLELGLYLAGVGLIVAAASLAPTAWKRSLRRAARWSILFGVLVAFVIPAALVTTSYFSEHYTAALREKYALRVETFQAELETTKNELLQLKEEISILSPMDSLERVKNRATQIATAAMDAFNASFFAFLYYIILLMFDLLFFPIINAFVLYKFVQFALGRMLYDIAPARKEALAAANA